MSAAGLVVLFASAARRAGLGWFFFATEAPHGAVGRRYAADGRCRARPPLRRHRSEPAIQGTRLRPAGKRNCTSLVFGDFAVSAATAALQPVTPPHTVHEEDKP